MNTIYILAKAPDNWAQFLAEPVKHWRTGYSARTLAHAWKEARGFPAEVKNVLQASPYFQDIEMLLGLPEHQVDQPGGRRLFQNDIWVLARSGKELVSIAVEGKITLWWHRNVRCPASLRQPDTREAELLGQLLARFLPNEAVKRLTHEGMGHSYEARVNENLLRCIRWLCKCKPF